MRVGSHPAGQRLVKSIDTSQRTASFYLSWYFRCFRTSESGWQNYQTPDGRAIMFQDAYFWQALEIICRTLNQMISEERQKATRKRK